MKTLSRALIFSFLAVGFSFAQTSAPTIKTSKLAENLYQFFIYIDSRNSVNMFAAIGPEGILLVDAGFARTTGLVKEELRKISDKAIKYVINTHYDDDHSGGNAALGAGATIVAHQACRDVLARTTQFPAAGLPKITYGESAAIQFNDQAIELTHLPGHTAGDTVVHLLQAKIVFLGDLVFSDSFPVVQADGRIDSLEKSLARLAETLPADTRILVGHGRELKVQELRTYLDMVVKTRALVQQAIRAGKSPNQAKADGVLRDWETWNSALFPETVNSGRWIDTLYALLDEGRALSAVNQLRKEFAHSGLPAMMSRYREIRSSGKSTPYFIESDLNNWGYSLLGEGKTEAALAVFTINTELFPGSANTWDSLGEACMAAGDEKSAITNYEKSLQLNPQNANAVEQLKKRRAQELNENLKLLQPIVNIQWQGKMKSPDGKNEFTTRREWRAIMNGSVVKYTSTVKELGFSSEGFYYWDPIKKEIALFEISSNRGNFQRGHVEMENGAIVTAGTITFPDRELEFRNTFEVTSDGGLLDTWFRFENGRWLPGHSLELRPAPAGQ
jgi:cyclase